jgi:trans-o-hydroxybenzylidenepyruvate hydratase-aldolase
MLSHRDIKGVIGIVPTCAKPGADDWRNEDTVDLDETARVTEQLIQDGVGCILTNGTTGECATLLWEEHKAFAQTVIDVTRKRVPLFVGTTTLSTRETIRRLRTVMDMSADGTLLGIPMWQAPDMQTAVIQYKSVAEAVPNAAIFVYANSQAFRFPFPPAFWGIMHREVPQVVGAKYQDVGNYLASVEACEGQINLAPVYSTLYANYRLSPETATACWTHATHPAPVLALFDALHKNDWVRAKEIQKDIEWAGRTQNPPLSREVFGQYNIQLEKIRQEATGYVKAGPMRLPYTYMPENMVEGAKEAGRRWAQLVEKYTKVAA